MMVQAVKSLLANLELIAALHPEQKARMILLRTWLELSQNTELAGPLQPLLCQRWLEGLGSIPALQGLWDLPSETAGPASGFGIFQDPASYALGDDRHRLRLSELESLHSCLEVLSYADASGGPDRSYYLIEGSYHLGLPLQEGHPNPDDYIVAIERSISQQPGRVIPLLRKSLRLEKELSHAAA